MNRLYILDGPQKGKTFDLENDVICYVGRSPSNHVRLSDIYVSRKHLKIIRRGQRYFIEDLNSKNGTSVDGDLIDPGVEIEIKAGVPIVIGVSVICIGKRCLEEVKALLDSITNAGTSKRTEEKDTVSLQQADEPRD